MFLDIGNLEQVIVAPEILVEKINYLKEGIRVKALFYGNSMFSVELPQFLELMVVISIVNAPSTISPSFNVTVPCEMAIAPRSM